MYVLYFIIQSLMILILMMVIFPILTNTLSVGHAYPDLDIQFFLDFQCPDSKDAYQKLVRVRHSLNLTEHKVKLTYRFSPLPYHFYSSLINQHAGPLEAQKFISFAFNTQEQFSEESLSKKTATQFISQFGFRTANLFKLQPQALIQQINEGTQSLNSLINQWKQHTVTKGVGGAPIFFANGILIDGAEDFGQAQWINFIRLYGI